MNGPRGIWCCVGWVVMQYTYPIINTLNQALKLQPPN